MNNPIFGLSYLTTHRAAGPLTTSYINIDQNCGWKTNELMKTQWSPEPTPGSVELLFFNIIIFTNDIKNRLVDKLHLK